MAYQLLEIKVKNEGVAVCWSQGPGGGEHQLHGGRTSHGLNLNKLSDRALMLSIRSSKGQLINAVRGPAGPSFSVFLSPIILPFSEGCA